MREGEIRMKKHKRNNNSKTHTFIFLGLLNTRNVIV